MTTSSFVARWNALFETDALAVVDARGRVTFRELGARVARASACLRKGRASLEGARVAMLVSPGAGWIEAFAGTVLAGGVAVPLSHLYPASELAWFVDDAQADTIVVSPDLADRVSTFSAGRRVVALAELEAGADAQPAPALADADVALMLYTSGTTGKPKGAMISHGNLATQAELLGEAWGWQPGDVLLHALPLHHLHGLGISLLTALFAGAAAHMLERFDAQLVWERMADASVWMAVPTMYQKLLEAYDAAAPETRARWAKNARSLRLATSGSAALPVTLAERWRAIAGSIPLERFGMTEIGVGMTNPLDGERKAGSVGRPLRTVGLRIVDEAGVDVAAGEPGEIWIRGPSVFSAYFRREEATRTAFEDGWFKTGDMATRDLDGYVRILGRSSVDILKSGGYKLSALEIEDALREHPGVAEVAVVGLPDETWGDLVTAAIVARPGHEAQLEEHALRAWAKQRIAAYKVPRKVVLLASLPRNAVGKVLKPELVRTLLA